MDILPGRRIINETWPLHLQDKNAILIYIYLTKKAVILDPPPWPMTSLDSIAGSSRASYRASAP